MGRSGRAPSLPAIEDGKGRPQTLNVAIVVVGIDIGNDSFHVLGLRQKWSRGQVEACFFTAAVPDRHRSLRRRASSQS
jgi:hypothetical protein